MKLENFAIGGGIFGAVILVIILIAVRLAIIGTVLWAIWKLVTHLIGGGT